MSTPPPLEEIIARARAGDGKAQYILAASLSRAGKRDEAERWLQEAAKAGEPDALYTLATRELQSLAGAEKAAALLARAAAGGGVAAARLLAVLRAEGYGIAADWEGALASVVSLAEQGDAASQREIAALLILNDPKSMQGAALMEQAASTDVVAAAVVVSRGIAGRAASADVIARAIGRLEAVRYPRMQWMKESLPRTHGALPAPTLDWSAIRRGLGVSNHSAPASEQLLKTPDVRLYRRTLPAELLEYVIAVSAPRLAPSTTVDSRDGSIRRDAYRTSLTATLGPVDQDLAISAINRRVAAIAGVDHQNAEFLSVLRYAPGEEYRPHFDWLPPGPDFDRGGQRVLTALLYLNGDYQGGETHFLQPDFKVRGEPGDLLVFRNALDDGSGDKASRHAGLPVVSGTKWLGSKWFRERRYQF